MTTEGTISTLLAACAEKASSVSLREGFALLERDALHRHPIDIALPLIVLVGGEGGSADGGPGERGRETLPGRRGEGWPLLVRLYGGGHRAILIPTGEEVLLGDLVGDPRVERSAAALLVPPLPPLSALASP